MIRKLLMAFIMIIISLCAAGCGGGGTDNPETGDTKARWGTAEFGTDKWNP